MAQKLDITRSSGSVFGDLGLPNAAEEDTKMDLAVVVNDTISALKLRQVQVAKLFGTSQSEVSKIANYSLSGISVARLLGFLAALGCDVEIAVRKPTKEAHPTPVKVREYA
jgi:predicted XRE-type DNA-binding protein